MCVKNFFLRLKNLQSMERIRQQVERKVDVMGDVPLNRPLVQRKETPAEHADGRVNNSPVQKALIIWKDYTFDDINLGKVLNKWKSPSAWLVNSWGMAMEPPECHSNRKWAILTIHPSLRHTLHSLWKYEANQSLRDWLLGAIKDIGNYCIEVPMNVTHWKTIKEVQAPLGQLELQEEVFDAQVTGLCRTMFTG